MQGRFLQRSFAPADTAMIDRDHAEPRPRDPIGDAVELVRPPTKARNHQKCFAARTEYEVLDLDTISRDAPTTQIILLIQRRRLAKLTSTSFARGAAHSFSVVLNAGDLTQSCPKYPIEDDHARAIAIKEAARA